MKVNLLYLLILLYPISVGSAHQEISYGFEYKSDYLYDNSVITDVAILKNGNVVFCWDTWGRDNSDRDVFIQIVSPDLKTLGEKTLVNTYLNDYQYSPKITMITTGDFIVCWSSMKQDGYYSGVYAQRFSSFGEKIGDEFRVNTYTKDAQFYQHIASNLNGEFMICWQSWGQDGSGEGIFGQMFNSNCEKVGNEFQINTRTDESQINPNIAACFDGSYIVCWENLSTDGIHTTGISGQRVSRVQGKIGGEFHIDTHYDKEQVLPVITSHPTGNFLICWNNSNDSLAGSTMRDVYGQFFSYDNIPLGESIQINSYNKGYQQDPIALALPELGFIILWNSSGQDLSGSGIYGKLYTSQGNYLGYEFRINSTTADDQWNPKAVLLSNGDYLVLWNDGGMINPMIKVSGKYFPSKLIVHTLKPFILCEPNNDITLKTINTNVIWQRSSNQVLCYPWELHYKIFVADNPDFSSPQIIEQNQDTTLTLQNLTPGTTYFWKVLAKNIAGDNLWSTNTNAFFVSHDATDAVIENIPTQPDQFVLHQNYPNPFNPETTILFDLPETGYIDISIYDISGKLVKVLLRESRPVGSHSVKWDGKNPAGNAMPSGIYICRMEAKYAGGKMFVKTVKMGLVR